MNKKQLPPVKKDCILADNVIVKLINIGIYYDNRKVLEDVNLTIKKGEIITIIGPNGSGKTTLARILLGLIHPEHGYVLLKRNIVVGYMPQRIHIERSLPIAVEKFLKLRAKTKDQSKMLLIAEEVRITHLFKTQLNEISGGELQRVLLARALMANPDLLVLDEPVQGIDVTGQIEFYKLIEQIKTKRQISVLMISHDLYMVMKATDHVVCLNHHVCCEGTPEDVSKNPVYLNLFGDEASKTMAVYLHHHDHVHS